MPKFVLKGPKESFELTRHSSSEEGFELVFSFLRGGSKIDEFMCLYTAYTVCKGQHQKDEIEFLVSCFTENGYDKDQLNEIVRLFEEKRSSNRPTVEEENEPNKIVTLPWIPGLSPKLRKTYRKHGYKAVFNPINAKLF